MEVISSYFKKNIKNYSFDDLIKRCFIEHRIYNSSNLSKNDKMNIKLSMMVLYSWAYQSEKWYHDFEKNKDFLNEVEYNINHYLDLDNIEFHFLEIKMCTLISSFFEKQSDGSLYWWWFNSNKLFHKSIIWKSFFKEILEKKWKENDITWIVTYEIEWKENKSYKWLIRYYKSFWFEEYWRWETEYSKFIKMKRKKW
jgi:hypothetical protein